MKNYEKAVNHVLKRTEAHLAASSNGIYDKNGNNSGTFAIGVMIFCQYSIIKNLHNYFKVRKNLNEYLAQFNDS